MPVKFTLTDGTTIDFPFEPYPAQKHVIEQIINCLKTSTSGLIESPTGSGKSFSILCATLSYLQSNLKSNSKERIFICSRTIKQIDQLINQLKKLNPQISITTLASRKQLCVNTNIPQNSDINEACTFLLKKKPIKCDFFTNTDAFQKTVENTIFNIEDIYKDGLKMKACPYFATRGMLSGADVVFAPYNYLVDPFIRKSLGVDLKGSKVIVDEAHNIEDFCRKAGSVMVHSFELRRFKETFRKVLISGNLEKEVVNDVVCLSALVDCFLRFDKASSKKFKKENQNKENNQNIEGKEMSEVGCLSGNVMNNSVNAFSKIRNMKDLQFMENSKFNNNLTGHQYKLNNGNNISKNLTGQNLLKNKINSLNSVNTCNKINTFNKTTNPLLNNNKTTNPLLNNNKTTNPLLNNNKTTNPLLNNNKVNTFNKDYNMNLHSSHTAFNHSNSKKEFREFKKGVEIAEFLKSINITPTLISKSKSSLKNITTTKQSDILPNAILNTLEILIFVLENIIINATNSYAFLYTKLDFENFKINFWLLDPSIIFNSLAAQVKSIVLLSGTLKPFLCLESELNYKFNIKVDAPHVIKSNNLLITVVQRSFDNKELVGKFSENDNLQYLNQIRLIVLKFKRMLRCGGCLVFVPSYSFLENLEKAFHNNQNSKNDNVNSKNRENNSENSNGNTFFNNSTFDNTTDNNSCDNTTDNNTTFNNSCDNSCDNADNIFFESKNASKFNKTFKKYVISVQNNTKPVLISVYRGRAAEGMDFKDDYARIVVAVGIPYPSYKDVEILAKREYNDKFKKMNGKLWYESAAFKAVNQAIGRVVRHRDDWGAVVLVDARYAWSRNLGNLPKWVKDNLKIVRSMSDFVPMLDDFLKAKCV